MSEQQDKNSSGRESTDLFIVDNSDKNWRVLRYLTEWADIASRLDVATGFFEIGALLAMDKQWQKMDGIRILMGDEVSKRTKKALLEGITERAEKKLDDSLEAEKEENDFLIGVPAIVEALKNKKILCRAYNKEKFHAKAYITHGRKAVVGSTALVGSSNFTLPGLTENVELNLRITSPGDVRELQEWYERHWDEAEDITADILKVIERHTRDYTPFEIFLKSLHEYFKGHEMSVGEWEKTESKMFHVLDLYQQKGYQALMHIARQYGGAFLCDAVGLGKTFIGLMVIERLVMHERKRVALFVPKAAREDVWERALREYIPYVHGAYSNLLVFNHTDLHRDKYKENFERVKELADVVVIDEAHHFRNPGIKGLGERKPSRYWELFDLLEGPKGPKQLYMLTATPINNKLDDFWHMIELFSRRQEDFFKTTLGIHSLRGHFIRMERELRKYTESSAEVTETNLAEAEKVLSTDVLFKSLVVQRSRSYVKESQEQESKAKVHFPVKEAPEVAAYSIKKTYGKLLDQVDKAFARKSPLFTLSIYYPFTYYKGTDETIDPFEAGRQKQVVALIRTLFLKRFESSAQAFELSCDRLLIKLLAWVMKHSQTEKEKETLDKWMRRHADIIGYVQKKQHELWAEDADEDLVTEEMLEDMEELSREDFDVKEIINDTFQDLDQILEFIRELRKFKPRNDDKLKALIKLLQKDKVLSTQKVIIFTEFAETARYLEMQLKEAGIEGIAELDGGTKGSRSEVIKNFAPYYNGSSSSEVGNKEIRVLISTDVLSEGLNLQDGTRLINYDLHWNPVRLMQRIGRVDRRLNPEIEKKIVEDHPDQKELRGKIKYWNFLPPQELEELLRLYSRVTHKTLRISKTFGIEGKKLLTPEDDWDALKQFNHDYEGTTTSDEKMLLEYQLLMRENPEIAELLDTFPGRVFSGKKHPKTGSKAVFFCYRLPKPDHIAEMVDNEHPWTEEAGETKWYLYDIEKESIIDEPHQIVDFIRSKPKTARNCNIEQETLSEIRKKVDKHIKNSYLKKMQAPVGVKPSLKSWMELS